MTSCRWMCAEVEWVRFYLHITYPRRRVPHRCRIHFSVCVELNFRTITIYIMNKIFCGDLTGALLDGLGGSITGGGNGVVSNNLQKRIFR